MEKFSRNDNFPSKMLKILTFWLVGSSLVLNFFKPLVQFGKLSVDLVGFLVRLTSLARNQLRSEKV